MRPFNWRCPYCDHNAVITDELYHSGSTALYIENAEGPRYIETICVVCPNAQCKRFTLTLRMWTVRTGSYPPLPEKFIRDWSLLPPARMKVLPEYVPRPIVQDYEEACSIAELSPKAAATLARRSLQGMIRDFWGISKSRLRDEVEALKDRVDAITWDAIDSVRTLGNIGAHMEKDINVIVDVDAGEARKLIEPIELLVDDWYVARHQRTERLKAIKGLADTKESQRKTVTKEGSAEG